MRSKAAAASWLGEGAAEGAAAAAEAVGEPGGGGGCGPTRASGANDSGEAERDGVLKRSRRRKLSCKLPQLITTRHEAGRVHQKKGQKMRCEPKTEETAGAVSRETPRPSPWGTRVVSHHGRPRRVRRAGEATRS